MRAFRSFVVLFIVTALYAGCAAKGTGSSGAGGGAAFNNGVLTTLYDTDIVTTYAATVKALTDLGMTIRNSSKDEHLASILATRPDDMAPVQVSLRDHTGRTGAEIKIGEDGNEGYSRVVANRIGARLKG